MKRPLFEALNRKGERIQFVTLFSRTELARDPIEEYLPEMHYESIEVWYAVLNEIEQNCLIGRHEEILPESLRYIGDL